MSACVRTERIHLFVDGELSAAEAEEVRVHLADCADCQAELDTVMQLDVLGDTLLDKKEQQAPAPKVLDFAAEKARRRPRRIAWISAASGLAAAAAIVLFVRPGNEADLYNLGQARPFEARLTHAGAAEYRPYEIVRAAGPHGVEVSLETMAKLEKAGDKQGVATAYLLRGEKVAAAETFAKAKESPEVDSDRAALSLMSGDAEGALALVEGVLRAAPTHPQALWNRGLALRDLGLTLSAAEAFEEVAKRNEPGWAQEAKARAEQL
ncbi:MAG: zf-HC2 domain-containing protein, partial [Deltaproteobacteria bacterium]|nr:zf-HC2 domain-containing protein [Deltaproteobacteria bacterium]